LQQLELDDFHTLVTHNGGMALARAVQATKATLSGSDAAELVFDFEDIHLRADVMRSDFENWIQPVTQGMQKTLQGMMQRTGMKPGEIDDVFLTGGTSFIPAVRKIYSDMFGAEKIHTGGEFTSVAAGLALAG
jgi:hypothetical chaperone protein